MGRNLWFFLSVLKNRLNLYPFSELISFVLIFVLKGGLSHKKKANKF